MAQPRILILGAPGAGKGTQSAKITAEFDVDHVTTGDALRANKDMDISDMDTEYDTPRAYMEQGELVPDEVVNAIVDEALSQASGFVLDGYPRNLEQAEELEGMTNLDIVLYLDVSEEELINRLTGRRLDPETDEIYHLEYNPPEDPEVEERLVQRDDDTEETVKERLRVFRENTEPVIDYYEEQGDLERVDGEQAPDEVWEDVQATIEDAS
ncbi:adenylate kinase [Natronobacterium gregoryi]|uniref:Adenylate kinase n=2 Tax=Natronobacterium gregoryi TaxID=44930 RepID=L0AEB6_NATGS|nr:adenylate kinase [Natronobacterium gregoryi]AFZ71405.1 adenylate kinase family protein [Natronobacterium gregoryi SP2]ELY66930.1 adenylate kinase [Natronobacterium gregoryi SP2]PLK21216.1 nucleoside monophosphate kinase [Natronobacterium gregoryi SP2]SFI84497.1 Adenylate kinase [Natronobacterium gregoryi]